MKKTLFVIALPIVLSTLLLTGCSSSKKVTGDTTPPPDQNRELALRHFLEGSLLDQKGENAKAILEYQYALEASPDPAIYHAIARDYSILGQHDRAIKMGREAVKGAPENRTYHQSLAEIYINARDLDGAIQEYQSIIGLDSSTIDGWLNLARLLQLRDPQSALPVYERIIERFGTGNDAYLQMAGIYGASHRLDKAAEALEKMLQSDPGNLDVKRALADTYLEADSVERALRIYSELVELRPDHVDLRAAMAHAYLLKQDYERATKQFDVVMKADSVSADDQLRFGRIFVAFIEKDSAVIPYAVKLFDQISMSYPTDWRPYWFLGAINNLQKDDSSALLHYQKVKELARSNPDGWVGIASIYYDRGKFQEAIDVLNEAKMIVPGEFRIHFLLGISNQRLHQPIEAATALERAIQINEKSTDALSALGLVYDEMKRHVDSDSAYERALRIDAQNHLVLNNYAYSLAERGLQLDRALVMSKEAVRQQPANQSYLDTYGWIYYRLGRYDEAEQYIRKAVELGSTSAVVLEHLGDVNAKLSRKEKAIEYWRRALELDSTNAVLKEKIERGNL